MYFLIVMPFLMLYNYILWGFFFFIIILNPFIIIKYLGVTMKPCLLVFTISIKYVCFDIYQNLRLGIFE